MPNSSLQKAKKRNLLLLISIGVIALAIYGVKELDSKKNLIYLPLNVKNLQEIIIHQTPAITLKKVNDSWFVMQKEPLPINNKALKDIFDMLSTPLRDEYPVADVSLEELSLEPPNLIVELDGEALSFGALSPIEQMHYVHFKDKVYLASPFLQVRFSQKLKSFTKANDEIKVTKDDALHGEH